MDAAVCPSFWLIVAAGYSNGSHLLEDRAAFRLQKRKSPLEGGRQLGPPSKMPPAAREGPGPLTEEGGGTRAPRDLGFRHLDFYR